MSDGVTQYPETEMRDHMENITQTLAMHSMRVQRRSDFQRFLDRVLPWRDYVRWDKLFAYWIRLWHSPDEFEEASLDEWRESKALWAFQLGVLFGIEYEQAYPEGRNEEWPVPVDERS